MHSTTGAKARGNTFTQQQSLLPEKTVSAPHDLPMVADGVNHADIRRILQVLVGCVSENT